MNLIQAGAEDVKAAESANVKAEKIQPSGRFVPLDALRGVAIFLVIFHHVGLRFPSASRGLGGNFLVDCGWAGVDLFFAISGYLITTILLNSSTGSDLKSFYIRRFFRIVPLYLVALALFFALALLTGNNRDLVGRLWINLTFLTAWLIPFIGENSVPYKITWSLSVEEFAYLLFGFAALLGAPRFRQFLCAVTILALMVRTVSIVCFGLEPIVMYYFAPGRIDAIAVGGLAAMAGPLLSRKLSAPPWIAGLSWAVIVAVLSTFRRENLAVATIGYTIVAFASAWLVLCVINLPEKKWAKPIEWAARLGLVSYFVYLFQGFVIVGLSLVFPARWTVFVSVWIFAITATMLTYLPAMLSWRFLEHPLIRFGKSLADNRKIPR